MIKSQNIRFIISVAYGILLCFISSVVLKADTAPKVIPPATKKMQHPEFWISQIKGDPDRVILTPEQITQLNKKTS